MHDSVVLIQEKIMDPQRGIEDQTMDAVVTLAAIEVSLTCHNLLIRLTEG